MAAKWIGFCVFMYFIGMFVGAVMSSPIAASANLSVVKEDVNILSNPQLVNSQESWGSFATTIFGGSYFEALGRAITLNFPIFTGDPDSPWQLVRYLCFGPIAATVVLGFILGVISIFSRVLS